MGRAALPAGWAAQITGLEKLCRVPAARGPDLRRLTIQLAALNQNIGFQTTSQKIPNQLIILIFFQFQAVNNNMSLPTCEWWPQGRLPGPSGQFVTSEQRHTPRLLETGTLTWPRPPGREKIGIPPFLLDPPS